MSANEPAARSGHRPDDDVEGRVRARLRELRLQRSLTLAEVAAEAGMDTSMLSRLESGARRLTLAHLPSLARALGVPTDELLAARAPAPARPSRPDTARPWRSPNGVTFVPVGKEAAGGMLTCRILLPAHLRERDPNPRVHAGHEWLHVLSGRLRLVLGDEERVLMPGEAAQFSTWTPHWSGVVDEPVELLATFQS
ncbi:helix-turn-helix domain-containing protein [Conexibacter sp. CPCC 206217]|uniref:helix-turn-helix domain-containing protein n=1 Tax=Conexibacter sp. CPCC 206217 TaxID=3064574 RepID=UPI0027181C60|nr:XRE family transcriptional regulator [Conexibacter sp. CPCC 206217]MDO8213588.1 XRE family transcriptional regulator [Conexibacter sp. CPCC 206217]